MVQAKNRTVALIDWNWMGHHPTHFKQFAEAIAQAGVFVVPFCSDPEDFQRGLSSIGLDREVAKLILSPQKIEGPKPSKFRPARWRGLYEARKFFGGLGKQLRTWQGKHSRRIDLAFFACIYDWQFASFRLAEKLFGFPWSGVYLHARSFRMPGSPIPYSNLLPCPEAIFSSPFMRSAVVRDQQAVIPMSKISLGKPIFIFPETTQQELPPEGGPGWGLTDKILKLASGRPIISLTGHLQWTKGLEEFTSLAIRPDMQDVFFFLGGEQMWIGTPPDRRLWMQKMWEQCQNIYGHLQHLPESTMNTIIVKSDVIFVAYKSFPNISNVLTKAAVFEKPAIVSDGYLMAEQVREFRMGEVAREGDVQSLAASIRQVLAPGYKEKLSKQARWAEFREAHSPAQLKKAMAKLLEASLK